MFKPAVLSGALAIVLGCSLVLAQEAEGIVGDTIAARRLLMNQLASLQVLVETRLAASEYSSELSDLGQAAAASLDAFAVLLPPDSNLLGGAPAVAGAETTAAAAIWDDLPAFQQLLRDTASQARAAANSADIAAFEFEWDKVAAACTSCHETYVFYDPFAAVN